MVQTRKARVLRRIDQILRFDDEFSSAGEKGGRPIKTGDQLP